MRPAPRGALARLVRLPLLPTALADSAAGYLISLPPEARPSAGILAALACASAGFYLGGMALNDVADLGRDRTLHPGRPLPSGQVSLGTAWTVFLLLALASLCAASITGRFTAFVGGGLFACVLAYNLVLKRWRLPGCLAMGSCRALNMAMGFAASFDTLFAGAEAPHEGGMTLVHHGLSPGFWAPAILGAYVFSVTLVSTFEETRPGAARWVALLLRGIIPLDAAMVLASGRPMATLGVLALLPLALLLRRVLPRHE